MVDDDPPVISCVICTFRRPAMLEKAIRSLSEQTLSHADFEVIIIDNNSKDQTPTIVSNLQSMVDFNLIYCLEVVQGLSYAKNTGIQNARGKYVAFLDDDAEADPEWLTTFVKVFEKYPNAWVVGGKILPVWDAERPSWLSDDLLNNFSVLDLGVSELVLQWPDHVLGTSCFHRDLFDEVGWFSIQLGRRGNSLVGDEDTEIQLRVFRAGKQIVYTPHAIVWHHIAPDRLTKRYIYWRAFGTGQSRAFSTYQRGSYRILIWHFFRAFIGLIYYVLFFFITMWNEKKRIKTVRSIYTKLGFLRLTGRYLLMRPIRK